MKWFAIAKSIELLGSQLSILRYAHGIEMGFAWHSRYGFQQHSRIVGASAQDVALNY